jgi:Homing endonuclease associated repeat
VAAMRDWARLTAGPPRSYEWAPATGRALGRLGPGPVRWEREHPRWPSTGAVVHHFGSFGAGLEAAGFHVPPRPELPAHEAAAAARRLASKGLSTKAIAVELGVAWATADGYLRGGDCPACGRPKAKPTSRTCPSCRASLRAGPPRSRDEIVELLAAWRRETGAPQSADWRPGGHPKWDREQPRWPGGQADARAFGGRWTRALAAAGVGPGRERTRWTDKRIVAALKDWADANGHAPTQKQWQAAGGVPSATTIRRHFGSWADALDAAGCDTRSP